VDAADDRRDAAVHDHGGAARGERQGHHREWRRGVRRARVRDGVRRGRRRGPANGGRWAGAARRGTRWRTTRI
jgi:hypothetical protein